jgi:hypothetical protein
MPTTRPTMPKTILNATIRSAVMAGGFPASSIRRLVRPYRSRGVRRVIDETTFPANGKMSRSRADVLSCSCRTFTMLSGTSPTCVCSTVAYLRRLLSIASTTMPNTKIVEKVPISATASHT